jgi:hypothetical protein
LSYPQILLNEKKWVKGKRTGERGEKKEEPLSLINEVAFSSMYIFMVLIGFSFVF